MNMNETPQQSNWARAGGRGRAISVQGCWGEFHVAKTSRHEAHGHGSSAILCSSGIYDCHICSSSISSNSNSNSSNIKCGSNTGHFSMGLLANECKRNAFV